MHSWNLDSTAMTFLVLICLLSTLLQRIVAGAAVLHDNCMKLTTFNYHYTEPYPLHDMNSDPTGSCILFNFSVRAVSDGHIKLSSSADVKSSPVTIEIIIGGGSNMFSAVRRKPKRAPIDLSVSTPNILSKKEMRAFSLLLRGEVIELYTDVGPVLRYEDSSVADMTYIAFGAWNNVGVDWSFDCKDAEHSKPKTTDPLIRLKETWSGYDLYSPPIFDNDTLIVHVSLSVTNIKLNAKDGLFALTGKFDVEWIDRKLKWNPELYGNITHLNFKHRAIWMPDLVLLDVPKADSSLLTNPSFRLHHSGEVRWSSMATLESWCNVDTTNWPNDEHSCQLRLGLHSHPSTVQVRMSQTTLYPAQSEWEVVSLLADTTSVVESDEGSFQSVTVLAKLRRFGAPFLLLFVVPLSVLFVALISSFTVPPHYRARKVLVTSSIVAAYLLLIMEDNLLPAHSQSIPHIMKITSGLLLTGMFQLISHSFNAHIVNFDFPAPAMLAKSTKKPWMKYWEQVRCSWFVSLETESTIDNHQLVAGDDDSKASANRHHWALAAQSLDLISFLISFCILPFLIMPL